ncbi:MAG: uracil phosphoribosyltransferase [Rikenellaceae bacterium]|nr:uracil phosphoribosyltransferase [Rikenellaceae bacterium]
MVRILDRECNTVLNKYMAELRDAKIQTDSMRFRRNLERVGEVMAYEISKTLHYSPQVVDTPLGQAEVAMIDDNIVLATILRAGLPFHQGFLNVYDGAQNAFVSAYRKISKDGSFKAKVEYLSCCDLTNKVLLLVDPMMATGTSMVLAYEALVSKFGTPKHTHVASVIASEEGLEYVKSHMPKRDVSVWCASVDEELTVKSYIIPGLGDAGDLAYGDKLSPGVATIDKEEEDDQE